MDDEFKQKLLERLKAIEQRLDTLEADQSQLREAYARSRAHLRRLWLRPPMWTFEQHPPRPLDLSKLPAAPALPKQPPRIAVVTPSSSPARFAISMNSPLRPTPSWSLRPNGCAREISIAIRRGRS